MTTVEEQVEAEQQAYEAANAPEAPEPDDPEPTEPPAPDDPEPPLSAIGPDEIAKAERAIDAQKKKLAGILGEEYVAHDCPMCSSLGFLPELAPAGTEFLLDVDEAGAPTFLVKPPQERPRVKAKDKAACDWCEGEGFVDTGSNNPHGMIAPCTKCSGNGWVTVSAETPAPPPPVAYFPEAQTATAPAPQQLGVDAWGRSPGHPHWGVPPEQIRG